MFINDLRHERNMLQLVQKHHLKELNTSDNPSGILLIHRHEKYYRWKKRYLQDDTIITVDLPGTDELHAEMLAINFYRLVCVQFLQHQIDTIDKVIRACCSGTEIEKIPVETAQEEMVKGRHVKKDLLLHKLLYRVRNYPRVPAEFFALDSPYRPLMLSFLQNRYSWIIDWYLGQFDQYSEYPEFLQFPVKLGYKVRSKSEAMIADRLFDKGILFHYEEKLLLSGDAFYPDFLIPLSFSERYAWEHFGAMDSEKYFHRSRGKILDYLDHRSLPGIDMLTTYETRKKPLPEEMVDQKVRWLKNRCRLAFTDLPPDDSFTMYDLAAHLQQNRV